MRRGQGSGTAVVSSLVEVPLENGPVSGELQGWLDGKSDKTLSGLIDLFGRRSFALLFVLLLGVPALPLPTGGATHVFEIIAVILAVQLIAGRSSGGADFCAATTGEGRFLTAGTGSVARTGTVRCDAADA